MATTPWTQADTDRLTDLHGQGMSLGKIAQEMHRGKATISNRAKAAGLTWNRDQVATATQAKVLDAKARKAAALLVELEILELSQQKVVKALRGEEKWNALVRGVGGAEETRQLAFVPSREKREEASSRTQSAVIINRLTDTAESHGDARNMLADLGRALGINDAT